MNSSKLLFQEKPKPAGKQELQAVTKGAAAHISFALLTHLARKLHFCSTQDRQNPKQIKQQKILPVFWGNKYSLTNKTS